MSGPLKIVFIEGAGRSGTTVLDTILGQLDGFFSTGELRFVWDRNVLDDALCGCGRAFSACPIWTDVFAKAFDRPLDPAEVIRARYDALRFRCLPRTLHPAGRDAVRRRAADYLDVLGRLYTAIADVTGARVVVDSSKDPTHGYLLRLLPGVEVYTVRMVRDPRALVYSWRRRKLDRASATEVRPMGEYSLRHTAAGWMLWNLLSEAYARQAGPSATLVRYEDFALAPAHLLDRILTMVDEPRAALPFEDPHTVRLQPTHTVGGNPNRFSTGTVQLRLDQEWQTGLSKRDGALVSAMCWPLMHRYGYRVRRAGLPAACSC